VSDYNMSNAEAGVLLAAESAPDWRMRPARLEDEPGVLALYRDAFGRERSGADWRWKLMSRGGPAPLVWVAETDAGEIIGHHGGIALRFSMAGEVLDCVQSVEAMTSPRHRRKGMLLTLGKGLYDSWRDAGVAFVLGMPNEKWGSRAKAIGFVPFARLRWLKFALRPSRMLAATAPGPLAGALRVADPLVRQLLHLLPAFGRVRVREVSTAGPEFDRIWPRAAASYRDDYVLAPDAAYVQWRFRACPRPYRLLLAEDAQGPLGYTAFRVTEEEGRQIGWLADVFTPRDDSGAWRALLRTALIGLSAMGADSVAALAVPGSVLDRRLRGCGFLPSKNEFPLSMVPGAWSGCENAMQQPGRWQLAGADFDVL
jgi:hypothetical protein